MNANITAAIKTDLAAVSVTSRTFAVHGGFGGGERKRGAWLSEQVRVWHASQDRPVGSDTETLRLQV